MSNSNFGVQIAFPSGGRDMYMRMKQSGIWYGWGAEQTHLRSVAPSNEYDAIKNIYMNKTTGELFVVRWDDAVFKVATTPVT